MNAADQSSLDTAGLAASTSTDPDVSAALQTLAHSFKSKIIPLDIKMATHPLRFLSLQNPNSQIPNLKR